MVLRALAPAAVYLNYGTLTVANCTISGNSARDGGGVYVGEDNTVTLANSTISANRAGGDGGGVWNGQESTSVNLINSTVSGNKAQRGGGVYNGLAASITVTNSTISGNIASGNGGGVHSGDYGYVTLARALISGNTAISGRKIFNDETATVTAANFNVFGHSGLTKAQALVGVTPSGTDITATSNGNRPTALKRILNITLANNGGPTKTHALVAGSPAIDAVNDGTCPPPARDQRGFKRPRDGNGDGALACDVGSFER